MLGLVAMFHNVPCMMEMANKGSTALLFTSFRQLMDHCGDVVRSLEVRSMMTKADDRPFEQSCVWTGAVAA